MELDNVEHIFFDLDHTLWDFDKNSALAFGAIFKEEGIAVELEDFLNIYIPINRNYWKLYENNQITTQKLRIGRLEDSFNKLEIKINSEMLAVLADKYIQFLPTFTHLLENAVEVLGYLKERYKLHIITNGFHEVQHTKMANSMIDHYFETVTTSDKAGVKKPDSIIFKKALQLAKAKPEESLMVGDNFEADVIGAQKAGLTAVFFDYYAKNEEVTCVKIQKLKELELYL